MDDSSRCIREILNWNPQRQAEYEKCQDPMKFFKDRLQWLQGQQGVFILIIFYRNLIASDNEIIKFDSFCIGDSVENFGDESFVDIIEIEYIKLVSGNKMPDMSDVVPGV